MYSAGSDLFIPYCNDGNLDFEAVVPSLSPRNFVSIKNILGIALQILKLQNVSVLT